MRARALAASALALASFAVACSRVDDSAQPDALASADAGDSRRDPAPAFTLPDLQGKSVSLADFEGRAVVLDFWATWCPPCIFQIPELNAFWKKHRGAGDIVVVGVAVDAEGAEVVGPWVAEQGVEYPILMGDEDLARRFGAQGFPTIALVRPDGSLDSLHVGLIEVADLEKLVEPLRAQKGSAPPPL
jgi:cytochrome c biogenesis protein CcmG/thiol:disulfide interchange protein DsbE